MIKLNRKMPILDGKHDKQAQLKQNHFKMQRKVNKHGYLNN
jgi:hypothetical protein